MPEDLQVLLLLDFLIMNIEEVETLEDITRPFEAALLKLQTLNVATPTYGQYLTAVHNKFRDLKAEFDYREYQKEVRDA